MLHVAVRRLINLYSDGDITLLKPHPAFENTYNHANTTSTDAKERLAWSTQRPLYPRLERVMPGAADYLSTNWPRLKTTITRAKMKALGYDPAPRDTFIRTFETADVLVVSGGGFITDVFEPTAETVLNLILLAYSRDVPVFMFGQGIGPIHNDRLWSKAQRALQKVEHIALRERKSSLPLLRKLGVPEERITVTGDDAVALTYSKRSDTIGRAIGVNLRVASYAEVSGDITERLGNVLNDVASSYEASLLPVPIAYEGNDSDVSSIRNVLNSIGVDTDGGASLDSPEAVSRQVGRCRVVVTGSYHGGVFALSQGVPVIGLSNSEYYDKKFNGLADMFGTGCTVLRVNRPDFEDSLREAVHAAWETAPEVRPQLLEAAERQIEAANAAYARMSNTLQS